MKITNNVKKLRQAAGMTQADLAARLGITTPSITKWEKGVAHEQTNAAVPWVPPEISRMP